MRPNLERRYFYARTVGYSQDVLERIINVVQDADLASQIPLVKLERSPRREFYVFLGVESSEGSRIPGGLGNIFANQGIYFDEYNPLPPEDISSMVQRQEIEIHGFNSLQYRRQSALDPGDPFDHSDSWQPREPAFEECSRHDRLLQWLSTRGEGTWAAFAQACEILGVAQDLQTARSAFRRLSLLGHIDRSEDGSRWSVSPAALVRFPDDAGGGFVSGERTASLIRNLNALEPLDETIHSHYAGPHRFSWESEPSLDSDRLSKIGIVDGGITALRLAELLPDLLDWRDSLQSLPGLSTLPYVIEKWQDSEFMPCDTIREKNGIYQAEAGMYRLTRDGDRSGRTLTLFFDPPSQRWLRGDWYGLRFLALVSTPGGVDAVHNSKRGELLIPETQRWPLLYERTLVLSSGLLPGRALNPEWLSYPRVRLDIAQRLCRKLNVDLLEE